MELEKAIEIVMEHRELTLVDKNPDLKKAVLLLIQAGKRIQRNREADPRPCIDLLPSED